MTRGLRGQKGSTMLEFVLVGIPIIFVLISIFEISRGMCVYHTLAYAVREGVRYAAMHGQGCAPPSGCQATIGSITSVIRSAGVGLDPNAVTLTFTAANGSTLSNTMANQLANGTTWPPSGANAPGKNVQISMKYPLRTALAVFWPGAGGPFANAGILYLPATSTEPIQF